tara:strand:- start:541 stop:918 length:378 start_codon:yes stop_codon:yes gene_type:complete
LATTKLRDVIWESLGCSERQTKNIIDIMLTDIALFDKKQRDYGPDNIAKFGLTGVLVRSSDKIERLINLQTVSIDSVQYKPEANEPIRDSWQDLSIYGAIARVLMDNNWMCKGGTNRVQEVLHAE